MLIKKNFNDVFLLNISLITLNFVLKIPLDIIPCMHISHDVYSDWLFAIHAYFHFFCTNEDFSFMTARRETYKTYLFDCVSSCSNKQSAFNLWMRINRIQNNMHALRKINLFKNFNTNHDYKKYINVWWNTMNI